MACPTCRKITPIQDSAFPPHIIVKQFPPNNLLAELKKSIDLHGIDRVKEQSRRLRDSSAEQFSRINLIDTKQVFCDIHGDVNADFVCTHHNNFLCKVFVTSQHRQAQCKVSLVDNAFKELSTRKELMKKTLEDQSMKLKVMLTNRKKEAIARNIRQKTLVDIRFFKTKLDAFYGKSLIVYLETHLEQPVVLDEVMKSVEVATKSLITENETHLSKIDSLDNSQDYVFAQYEKIEGENKAVLDKTNTKIREMTGSILQKNYNVTRAFEVEKFRSKSDPSSCQLL